MEYNPVKTQKRRTKSFVKNIINLLGKGYTSDSTVSVSELNEFTSSASADQEMKSYVFTSTVVKGDELILGSWESNAEATSGSSGSGTCRSRRKKNTSIG